MSRTLSLEESADYIGGVRPEWLRRQLIAGRFPGHKIGKSWRMTLEDIEAVLSITARGARSDAEIPGLRLTPTSRRRAS